MDMYLEKWGIIMNGEIIWFLFREWLYSNMHTYWWSVNTSEVRVQSNFYEDTRDKIIRNF